MTPQREVGPGLRGSNDNSPVALQALHETLAAPGARPVRECLDMATPMRLRTRGAEAASTAGTMTRWT